LYGFYLTDIDGGYNHNNDNLKETKAWNFAFGYEYLYAIIQQAHMNWNLVYPSYKIKEQFHKNYKYFLACFVSFMLPSFVPIFSI
jgi:hypothetical protein